jgi:photosystem II stability/assembly factor-like uncharacterized protein
MRSLVNFLLALVFFSSSVAFGKLVDRRSGSGIPTPTQIPQLAQPDFGQLDRMSVATLDGSIPNRFRRQEQSGSGSPAGTEVTPPIGWTGQSFSGINIASVAAVSRDIAWMCGTAGVVIRTTDGGGTWEAKGAAPVAGDLYNVAALNADTAFVTASGTSTIIWRTTNAGVTWTEVYNQVGGFIDVIHMFDNTSGIALGDPVGFVWTILKTTNGGATWNPISTPLAQVGTEAGWNNSMASRGSTHLWFGTNDSRIYRSVDGGETWTSSPTTFAPSVTVAFVTTTNGICGGSNGELNRTTDGGATWVEQTSPGVGSVTGGSESGGRDLWLVQSGTVYRSPDKGVSWQESYTSTATWQDMDFVTYAGGDTTSGWVGASNGTIGAFYGVVTPPPPPVDIRPILVADPLNLSKHRVNFSPKAKFQNAGSATQTSIPVRVEILNSLGSVIYTGTSSIASLAAEAEAEVTFSSFTIPGSAGTFSARAISSMSGDAVPTNDTITVEFYVPGVLSGTYTVGAGGNIATLKAVGDTLNRNDIGGPTTFSLITNGTYNESPILIRGISYATTPQPVTIKPATGVTAKILVSDAGDLGYGMEIDNTANLTIEGPNLSIEPDTTVPGVSPSGILLNSVQNVTFRNLTIKGYYTNTITTGVYIQTLGGVANRNLTFENVKVSRVYNGILHAGNPSGNRDTNFVIRNCQFGAVDGSITVGRAIWLNDIDSAKIENNVIDGVGSASFSGAFAVGGIFVSGGNSAQISGNIVKNLANSSASSNAYEVTGIRVLGSGNRIWNNMVLNLSTSSTSLTASIRGIYTKGVGDGVYFNSVYLSGSTSTNIVSACYQSDSIATAKNNVLFNNRTDGTTGRSIALWKNIGSASLTSDHNLFFAPGATTGKLAASVSTNYTDLAAWTSATSQDANSRRGNPQFANAAVDLHVTTSLPTPVEGGSTPIAGITTDIDGNARHVSTPDIGADEGTFIAALANDLTAFSVDDPVVGVSKKVGTKFAPRATFINTGLSTQAGFTVRFRIFAAADLVTPVYDNVKTVASLASGATMQMAFDSVTIASVGDYVARAIAQLGSDGNLLNDTASVNFVVKGALAGTYNIPSTAYPTIASALSDLRAVGISASVKFLLTAASYPQTATLVIDSVAGASASAPVVFKPAPGVTTSISGDVPLAPLLTLNGCDFVTIDGSNVEGGTSRNLTLSNTTSQTVAAVVFVRSRGTNAGSTNNTIKNCNIAGGVDQNGASNTVFGIISAGSVALPTPGDGNDNDKNKYINNYFSKLRIGLWFRGGLVNTNDSTVVTGNVVGPASFGVDQIGRVGIILQYQNAATVTQNEVRFIGGDSAGTPVTSALIDRIGIGIGGDTWPTAGPTVNNSTISRNLVHDLVEERGGSAIGIFAGASNSSGQSCIIANNMVYNVRSNSPSAGKQAIGIGVAAGNGTRIVYNSISMSGDLDPAGIASATQSAAGLRVVSSTPTNLVVRNNIISVNISSNNGALKHYAIVVPAAIYPWGTGGSNYNDLYVAPTNSQMVLAGLGTAVPYTDVATLPAWQGTFTPNQDLNSISADPVFAGASNLHIVPFSSSPVSNAGTPVAGVTDDIDGDTRTGTPDIGADEYAPVVSGTFVNAGWNMVSNPVTTASDSLRQLFGSNAAFPYGFAFSSGVGYVQDYTLENGAGYWGKFNAGAMVVFSGTARTLDTIDVVAGWNMVGTISTAVDTSTITSIPPGIRPSTNYWYGYNGGYSASTSLVPGKGYWIKVNAPGQFVFAAAPAPEKTLAQGPGLFEAMNTVTMTDALGRTQTLYFGIHTDALECEMPPMPPEGAFDARFSSAGGSETSLGGALLKTHTVGATLPVSIRSAVAPVTLSWNIQKGGYTIDAGQGVKPMSGQGTVTIANPLTRLTIHSTGTGLPMEFALLQNYPNPFNPSTTVKFALPVPSKVAVEVFNLIGQRVNTLLNDVLPAGYHSVEWKGVGGAGQQLASGVYFIRFSATGTDGRAFNDVRKAMLMK